MNMMKKFLLFLSVFCTVLIIYSCNSSGKAPERSDYSTGPLVDKTSEPELTPQPSQVATPDPSAVSIDAHVEPEYGIFIEDLDDMRIVVYKSDRVMEIYNGDSLAARFKIALGFTPEGAKLREGDGKTPEGEYFVCLRNEHSKFYLSVGLSYPNIQDAQAGYDRGDITGEQLSDITDSIESGRRPPWDTPLGGEIMIHGSGALRDWTAGCIALENEDMDYIWEHAEVGTEVTILP